MSYRIVPFSALDAFCTRAFTAHGFTPEQSRIIADVVLAADLSGIESHGVQRMWRYHKSLLSGETRLDAEPEIVHETPVSAVMDAHRAMGQLTSHHAMRLALEKAAKVGIGMVTVRNSNHYGIAGYYTDMALSADMIGICMTNTEAIMVPTFGKQAMLGTSPIAFSMPADPIPFNFDASTTVVTLGKFEVYKKRGEPTPHDWAVDQHGKPTRDAALLCGNVQHKAGGGILPLGGAGEATGGHKGYGLGLIVDICTAILSGGPPSAHMKDDGQERTSHCFWAIDYGIFGDKAAMRAEMSRLLTELRESPKADGHARIYTHGEKERENQTRLRNEGIPVAPRTYEELLKIGEALGVDVMKL